MTQTQQSLLINIYLKHYTNYHGCRSIKFHTSGKITVKAIGWTPDKGAFSYNVYFYVNSDTLKYGLSEFWAHEIDIQSLMDKV